MRRILLGLGLALSAAPAYAWPELSECDWRSSGSYIAEPWHENSVIFGNGSTRVALIDTVEPAAAAFGLLILSPPYSEMGERQCRVLHGFSALSMEGISSAYDPSIGLQLSLTGQVYLEDEGQFASAEVDIVINQGTGDIDHFITPYID